MTTIPEKNIWQMRQPHFSLVFHRQTFRTRVRNEYRRLMGVSEQEENV